MEKGRKLLKKLNFIPTDLKKCLNRQKIIPESMIKFIDWILKDKFYNQKTNNEEAV